MKKVTFLIAAILLFSCQQNSPGGEVSSAPDEPDSIITPDTPILLGIRSDSVDSPKEPVAINPVLTKTDSFLLNPFDLYAFKSTKNGSNSGGAAFKSYHHKPPFPGIGYRFFMFQPKTPNMQDGSNIRHVAAGYSGTNKKNISMNHDGLLIRTFQPNDSFKHKYHNPNEVLIELTAMHNDFDLPEMAFVGLDSLSIIKQLGKETFYKNQCLIYTVENIAFILKLKNTKVDWIRYIRLAGKFENYANDNRLYQLDGNE